ncbi:MAG: Crp/Fnr family transcriptional regulator [Gammaproteobacteria bacterium]|nr:Crp/Fnr family transcriptional regulator [Gammaproteobacteria bacterium]
MNSPLIPVTKNKTSCQNCSVRKLTLFHHVPLSDLAWTENFRSDQFKVSAHKVIVHESKHSDYLFTVYHGWFAIYRTLENGKKHIIRVALPGDILCFQANLNAAMSYSISSLSDGILCAFPKKTIPEILSKNTFVAKRLSEMNARDMAICHQNMMTLAQRTAREKIAHLCIELYHRLKVANPDLDEKSIFFPLSQEDLGCATGLTNIHINRTLKSLRNDGLMEIKSKCLAIYNFEELQKMSGFDKSTVEIHSLYEPFS